MKRILLIVLIIAAHSVSGKEMSPVSHHHLKFSQLAKT
jgi:hypothetical protein